jgi:hypothetical protein
MYSFVHSKTQNRFGVEKAEALVYIYRNSRLLRRRPGADLIRYHDDNFFLEDSDDDGGAFAEMNDNDNDDNDDNNGNGGEGHDGSNGDSSGGGREYHRLDPPIIPRNLYPEAVLNWNGIDEEIANDVDGNMHVNEDAPVYSVERVYDRVDEEPDDDEYDEVANEHGKENGNAHGRNGDGNNCCEGGATGAAAGGNNDTASVGSGDGGSSNVPHEEQTKEAPNQGIEIQDDPSLSDTNINSQVPNVVIPVVNNSNEDDNAPLNHMYTSAT